MILFDEIDRLLLDRDSPEYARQDDIFKFMTPGMLTKLRTLRRLERCVFIVATNYEDRIDPAAKRHGRIDDRILVLPPDKHYREIFLQKQLEKKKGPKPSGASWKQAIEKSALYTFPELSDAVKSSFDGKTSPRDAITAFVDYISQGAPEIRLATYVPRFGLKVVNRTARRDRGSPPTQIPAEEFRAVCAIACENPASPFRGAIAESLLRIAKDRALS